MWNSATSSFTAGSSSTGSAELQKGLSISRQSARLPATSEPITPRRGMNGTPFSVAWSWACSAGQVESRISNAPVSKAAEKRGARPYSPSVTAAASTLSTQPAPISMSPWIVVSGRQ